MINDREVITLILFGGKGKRFGWRKPKQFFVVNGKPVAEYTIEAFEKNPYIDNIIVVSSRESINDIKKLTSKFSKVSSVIEGGETRTESSMNGVFAIKNTNSLVLIHDGVRPLVTQRLINDIVENLIKKDAIIPCLKIFDTVVEAQNEKVSNFLDREKFYRVQTPQGFKYEIIFEAYRRLREVKYFNFPDDSSVVSYFKISDIHIVNGDLRNIKVTTMDDIELMKFYLAMETSKDY